jgi:hypothetical protein
MVYERHTHTQTLTDTLHKKLSGAWGLRRLTKDVCANRAGYCSGYIFLGVPDTNIIRKTENPKNFRSLSLFLKAKK